MKLEREKTSQSDLTASECIADGRRVTGSREAGMTQSEMLPLIGFDSAEGLVASLAI